MRRCPYCDRAECLEPVQIPDGAMLMHYGLCAVVLARAFGLASRCSCGAEQRELQRLTNARQADCEAHRVDWRARALTAEDALARQSLGAGA